MVLGAKKKTAVKTYRLIDLKSPDVSTQDLLNIAIKIYTTLTSAPRKFQESLGAINKQIKTIEEGLKAIKKRTKILQAHGEKYGINDKRDRILINTAVGIKHASQSTYDSFKRIGNTWRGYWEEDYGEWFKKQISKRNKNAWARENVNGIFKDLIVLRKEFESVTWHTEKKELTVTTNPIILIDKYNKPRNFGSMTICLIIRQAIKRISREQATGGYFISPITPYYAKNCDESYFHPHISDNILCEGEAKTAITQCLSDFRFLDFFSIILNTLKTYNPNSPYKKLEYWDGIKCIECGEIIDSDEDDENHYTCFSCKEPLCDDCCRTCNNCHRTFCSDHGEVCSICGTYNCSCCMVSCAVCNKPICVNCYKVCTICDEMVCNNEECYTRCYECRNLICNNCSSNKILKTESGLCFCNYCKGAYNEQKRKEERAKEANEASEASKQAEKERTIPPRDSRGRFVKSAVIQPRFA